jgi:carbamoyltransferase
VPAIVHVDGTARVQTVRREHNERLYLLLKEFEALTGVPVLLNTSFNIRGEPIVESPADAMKCFLSTGIDYLSMHNLLIAKKPYYKYLYPLMKWGSDVATMVKVGTAADLRRGDE